jgi:hypothetical protein
METGLMPTNRTRRTLARRTSRITAEMVDAFIIAEKHKATYDACRREEITCLSKSDERCRQCIECANALQRLDELLGTLPPWDDGPCGVDGPNPPSWVASQIARDAWRRSWEIRQALEAATAERAKP